MESEIERLELHRRRMLLGFLAGVIAWQVPQVLEQVWGEFLPAWVGGVLTVIILAGFAGFAYFGSRMWQIQRRLQRAPGLAAAVNDERFVRVRDRSIAFGFWTLLIYIAGVRAVSLFWDVPATGTMMQLGLVVAATAPIVAFLWLEREPPDAE